MLKGKKDPDADDLEKVPYINAVISESHPSKFGYGILLMTEIQLASCCFVCPLVSRDLHIAGGRIG